MDGWHTPTAIELAAWVGLWWWSFVRLAAAFWTMPLLGDYSVNVRARILLAFLLSLLVAALHRVPAPVFDPLSIHTALLTLTEVLFGALFGFAVQCLFWLLDLTGMVLSQQMGLAMAVMNDPMHGESVPLVGDLLGLLCGLLFLTLNGHLVVLDLLVNSLKLWPPDRRCLSSTWRKSGSWWLGFLPGR